MCPEVAPAIDTSSRVYALAVESIEAHPNADNLTLVRLRDHPLTLVANKLDDGSFRYRVGQILVLLPMGAILPEWLLREMDAWKENPETGKGKGLLAGNRGDRVGARKFAPLVEGGDRFESKGAMRPALEGAADAEGTPGWYITNPGAPGSGGKAEGELIVQHGTDVTDFLGVTFR